MENNRPRSREKNVTGPGKKVEKRGKGLGTGPVGDTNGYADRRQQEPSSSGTRSAGTRSGGGLKMVLLLLAVLLGGGGGLTALLGGPQYLEEHRFPAEAMVWQTGTDGTPVLRLNEEQWRLVQELDLNLFYDDGEGYIDLGLDSVFDFDGDGGLIGKNDGAWLAVNGQPVAYYHTSTVDDGVNYTITGRVPVLDNDSRAELILVFDNENPHGFAAGVQSVYLDGETDTAAKLQAKLQPGDTLAFLCDYYSYAGDYQDSYLLGEPLTVTEEGLVITDVPLEGRTRAAYRFTDLYGQHHWTPVIPEA